MTKYLCGFCTEHVDNINDHNCEILRSQTIEAWQKGCEVQISELMKRLSECEMSVKIHREKSFTEREAAARILKMDERIEALEKLEHNDGNDKMLDAAKFWHKKAEEYRCKYIYEKQHAEHWCKESQKLNAKLEFIEGELKTNKIIIKEGREANEKLLTDNRNYVKGIERLKQQIADRDKTIAALREQMHEKCGCPFGSLT